ncbi:MAG: 4-alpha-glucanotransferase [Phycisphaerales bacterium]|nr:4-alpha-glucanotransferase [Phycisphaerales bacterium]
MSIRADDRRDPSLLRLARSHGLLTEHENGMGVRCYPSEKAIVAVLRALGVDIEGTADAQRLEPAEGGASRAFWRGEHRALGIFAPLYALRSDRSGGAGDLEDLARLCEWAGGLGASLVSTLPLLAGRHASPEDGCPYAPVSRSVFGEFYLDLSGAMTEGERREAERLNSTDLIDYSAIWALKRRVLEREAASADASAIASFAKGDPLVAEYARWRGIDEGEASAEKMYLYGQMLMHEQLSSVRRRAEAAGCGMYLDLPVGVIADGFDVARRPDVYAKGIAVGAPPDAYFPEGQVWGFPPLLPEKARESGHAELIEATRRHLRYASTLRLDHVMGLWRLYWIPDGYSADDGVYVQYDAAGALDALADLSHEYNATFIGENLGTVPPEVDEAMIERNSLGMTAAQYDGGAQVVSPEVGKPDLIASANTHDMPTFAGYLAGRDIELRESLGLVDRSAARRDQRVRREAVQRLAASLAVELDGSGSHDAFDALVERLCRTSSPVVMVSMDDLLGETEPQNIPGVQAGYPCWRRPLRARLEGMMAGDSIASRVRHFAHVVVETPGAVAP